MSTAAAAMSIKAIAPWYGANRMFGHVAGEQIGRCKWVGVPFCGGCAEIPHIQMRSGVANDVHRHIINLCRVIADVETKHLLELRLSKTLFHIDVLREAQRRCIDRELAAGGSLFMRTDDGRQAPDVDWAFDYFCCCWMGPSAKSGKATEFNGYFAGRWTASGGDSATRFRSAIASLEQWHAALLSWNFTTLDALVFISKCKDEEGHAIYCDAPWPDKGDEYKHRVDDGYQSRLAHSLRTFKKARVVIRFNEHPLVHELYPEGEWTWLRHSTRNQANADVEEVLIVNGPLYSASSANSAVNGSEAPQ